MRREVFVVGVLALLSRERPAEAGLFELLDWACNPDGHLKGTGEKEALEICHMTAGEKKACDVVDGEPFVCFAPKGYAGFETCEYNDILITVDASTQQVLGWKIKGEITIDAGYKVEFHGDECRPEIRPEMEDRGVGTFVRRAGTAKLHTEFYASGEGYITFLGGKIFGKKYTKECISDAAPKGHIADRKAGCKATCPAPKAPGAVALECETEPSDPGDGEWTPWPPTPSTSHVDVARHEAP
jgi:hypothetical protein